MNRKCDVLIIGAGILGCFAARSFSRYALDTVVIEKCDDVCCGITKANTGIIYQGYDQHPGSLKAQLCRKASASFPALCEELDIPYRKCGLLMLSFGPKADQILQKKLEQGKENGITDIRILDADTVRRMEPDLCSGITGALYSENTYTVNPWEMGIAAYENAVSNHVDFFFREEAVCVVRQKGGFLVETGKNTYTASLVLCCGGISSDRLWELCSAPKVRILPMAADYIVFDSAVGSLIQHVISVEPEEKGNGITLVPTVDGNILAGPTRRRLSGEPDGSTDRAGLTELEEKCAALLPGLSSGKVIRNFGAVRPNPFLVERDGSLSGRSLNDFMILEDNGFFALVGIKTPGITCACELGNYVSQRMIRSMEKNPGLNSGYSPNRKGIHGIGTLLRDGLPIPEDLSGDSAEIICRCEHISKGEILEAIRRGALTVDGIKRRTGAGMGRCQGGYCMEKILHILSSYSGKSIYEITKDGPGSEILKKP